MEDTSKKRRPCKKESDRKSGDEALFDEYVIDHKSIEVLGKKITILRKLKITNNINTVKPLNFGFLDLGDLEIF